MTNILNKLYTIQKSIDVMPKDGYNNFNNYNYLSEVQVTTRIKKLLDEHQVFFQYTSNILNTLEYKGSKGDTQFLVTVVIDYKFYDVESGEFVEGQAVGQGSDKGDKAIYKAITGAIKYIYMKTFNIPTGDDVEKDEIKKAENTVPKENSVVAPVDDEPRYYEFKKPISETPNKCDKCGGDKILNPKTGKTFCKNKCWLNKPVMQDVPLDQIPF